MLVASSQFPDRGSNEHYSTMEYINIVARTVKSTLEARINLSIAFNEALEAVKILWNFVQQSVK